MKFRSLLALLSAFCTSLSAVEYGFLNSFETEASIILDAGDRLDVLMHNGQQSIYNRQYLVAYDLNEKKLTRYELGGTALSGSGGYNLPTYYGPLKIVLEANIEPSPAEEGSYNTVQYRLTRASELEYKNVNIISLPSDSVGVGTHEICVEASDDLQTWTPVHSSSIGGNRAFFRTRVVRCD